MSAENESLICPHCSQETVTAATLGHPDARTVRCAYCREIYPLGEGRTPKADPVAESEATPPALAQAPPIFRCPYCSANAPPVIHRVTSTAGYIFAIVLLLFLCIPIFWIGLLMKEDQYYCRICHMRLR